MQESEIKDHIVKLQRYEQEVIDGIMYHIKHNPEVKLLRLRVIGIDCIRTDKYTAEELKKAFKPQWGCEWLEI